MKIFFDTEFIEDGKTIELLSIGMVRDDGASYYAESSEAHYGNASDWVRENVLPHLGHLPPKDPAVIRREIVSFVGDAPEFWGYYADYDWVVLCQLFGRMVDLPKTWPMFCLDIKQLAWQCGNPKLPKPAGGLEHHALRDAAWNRESWKYLMENFV